MATITIEISGFLKTEDLILHDEDFTPDGEIAEIRVHDTNLYFLLSKMRTFDRSYAIHIKGVKRDGTTVDEYRFDNLYYTGWHVPIEFWYNAIKALLVD